ncbi:MAG: hypothetical protein JW779_02200 [Candidatus Thorarchaeota archaeon]|nr:hypothetical protein [Candidatus Thorarchaeota archaeon]
MEPTRLLSKQSKEIEREIVTFYKTVGNMVSLNSRTTEIFAYLRIYDALTQEQLKQLTGFSLGTISTTLQSFLQTDIINHTIIPGTHKNLYRIRPDRVDFVYTATTKIIENLERLDGYIMESQTELRHLMSKYPREIEFLHYRLNSLRNYIEAQRRQISREKRYSFFQEDTSGIVPLNEVVVYSFETRELDENLMDIISLYKEDPVKDRILRIFFTHRSLDQQTLIELSRFSRSTISRYLRSLLANGYIIALPKEYQKPRIYYLNSISRTILSNILKTDNFIYSYVPRFQEILYKLHSEKQSERDSRDIAFLEVKIGNIIKQIEFFKKKTRFLRQAYQDLCEFLEKNTSAKNP